MQIVSTDKVHVTYSWSEKDHPVWGYLKVVILTCCLAFILWLFAEHFDKTEIKALVGTHILGVIFEGVNVRKKISTFWRG